MAKLTRTIKLKFVNLNRCKAQMFEQMTQENTRIANQLLSLPIKERQKMTTVKIVSELKSAIDKPLSVDFNSQNWKLSPKGGTYLVIFPTLKGEKRIPIEVASSHWQPILDGLLNETIQGGAFKLIKHRGNWYIYLSVTEDVPEVKTEKRLGCDRHSWAFYSLEQKLDYKLALKGLKLIKRPAPYTSKSCSTCGVIGTRKKHDFKCPNGQRYALRLGHLQSPKPAPVILLTFDLRVALYHHGDLNAARNLSQWDGFSCDLSLKKDASVMDSSGSGHGAIGTPPNSVNRVKKGRMDYIQLSLFDLARYENPTPSLR